MKFLAISLSVLSVHLAVLGWIRVNEPADQRVTVLPSVQIRQIVAPPEILQPPAPAIQSRPERPALQPKPLAPPIKPVPLAELSVVAPATSSSRTLSPAQDSEPPAKPDMPSTGLTTAGDAPAIAQVVPTRRTTLPSSMADYLSNPPPLYPALSLRLNEQGKVVVRVLIGKDGRALKGDVFQSSGFDRLDRAALKAVLAWRYVPGSVDGQPQDMWFDVPVNFKPPN